MGFTKEQLEAINKDGTNIIVSAGAGSGKTAVLTERVIRKLKQGIDISSLLVLTFTNEAANEMKSRIREAIIKNNLMTQLSLLDSSHITTFDSFALFMVKKYHYLLNVSNNISIVDNNIILIQKYKVIDNIFENMYGDSLFNQLVDDFCLKDDKMLKKSIIELSNKLDLLIDKKLYLNNYIDYFYNKENIRSLILKYKELIDKKILELRNLYDKFQDYIPVELSIKLDKWFKPLFSSSCYNEYVLFNTMDTVRFTSVSEDGIEIKKLIKEKIDEIKNLLRFENEDEIINSIMSTRDYAMIIIDIIKQLDISILEYKNKYDIYEFNDVAHMAIEIVRDNIDVREEVKNQFNEIMLDEYQDTSSIQEEFIEYISNNNVYMVGDVKQSIYRFRNANPYIFQAKYNNFNNSLGGIKIDLLKNFRSRSETLFNINEIFNLIMDDQIGNADYLVSHNMVYGNTLYDLEDTMENNELEIYNYKLDNNLDFTREEKELFIVSEDIRNKIRNKYQVFDKKTGKLRDIKYSDICIITDRNKYLDTYKKILEFNEIPSVLYKDEILTNDDDILILINLMSLVYYVNENIYDDKFRYVFTSVARSFLFEYSDDRIYEIINNRSYKSDNIVILCKSIDIYLPLVDIINDIVNKFNFYECLTKLNDIDKSLIRVSNLLDIANSVSTLNYNILDFIDYIKAVVDNGLSIKYSINTGGNNAVKIMNIHKSKGLEFSLCYFTGMHNKFTIKEINDRILFDSNYGIIMPYKNDNLENLITKDLYVNDYILEEISEKIRLFYVALTRCREKMIIVTSLNDECDKFSSLVPADIRIKYRCFLDILNSLGVVEKYIVNKEAKYTHDYENIKIKNLDISHENEIILKKEINLEHDIIFNNHFSKESNKLLSKDEIILMEQGTKIHETLEYSTFQEPDNIYVKNLLKQVDNDFINVYREYEFMYYLGDTLYNGVIDLMLEYDDYINIIDYKLRNIDDLAYIRQLNGYKKYIESISNKRVDLYLYSILNDELKKID